jgi:hypothetical protein
VVILTFVTNDIAEIWSRSRAELIQGSAPSMASRFATQMIQHSAVAELSFDTILKTRFASYRASDRAAAASPAATRTDFTGGDRFDDNVREFEQRYAGTDGLVLRDDWSADTSRHVDDYLYALAAVRDFCAQQGSTLLLVYFPAYSQVYGHASRRINDTLASRSRELGIRFLDLTGTFREKGRGAVLHLTPVDYHLNPAGNVVLAAAIGEFLLGAHLLGA